MQINPNVGLGGAYWQGVPVQAHEVAPVCENTFSPHIQLNHLVQNVQENYHGNFQYGAQFPIANPEPIQDIGPHPAPFANVQPANGLRNLAGWYLNNPEAVVNMLRIGPAPGGRVLVWVEFELPDIF